MALPLLALFFSVPTADAQRMYGTRVLQDFETTIRNVTPSTTNLGRFDFDLYLLDTDPSQDFVLAGYQAGIYVNPGILPPGATVTVAILNNSSYSGLLPAQQPQNVEYDPATNLIKLAGRVPPGPGFVTGPDTYTPSGTIISKTGDGTRICRLRFTASLPLVTNSQGNFEFMSSEVTVPLYATRVSHYDYTNATIVYDEDIEEYVWGTPPLNVQLAVIPGLVGEPGTNAHVYSNPIFNPSTCEDPTLFNVTGGGSYCEGGDGVAVGLDGSQLGVNYAIVPGTQVIAGTGSAITFDNQLAGTYTITATSDGTNPLICTDPVNMTGVAVVIATPLQVSTVSIVADPSGPVCAGTTVNFTATPENGGDQPAYEWFVGGVSQGIDFTGSFSYVPVDGDAVYVVMIPDILCSAGNATSNTIDMVVEEPLPVSVSIEADDTEVCAGTSVTFTATPVNGGTPDYQWYLNGNTVGNNSAIYSVIPENGDQVYVVMNSSLECTTGNPATSNTVAITVNPVLSPSVSIVADPAGAVTPGTSVTFTATPVNGGVPTYTWFVNYGSVGSGNPYTYIPANGDLVYVEMISSEECVDSPVVFSNQITMVVEEIIQPPVAFEMTGGGSYCEGEDGVVVGLSGSEIGVTYTLYQDATAVASTPGTGAALDFGLRLEGVYTASGTNAGGTTAMTGSAIVIENALPVVTCPADMDVCINAGGQTLAGGSPTGGVYSGNGVTDGIFYPAVANLGTHTITYTYTDSETGCTGFCTFTITVLPTPAAAGAINGLAVVTEGDMGVAYNVGEITHATAYVWAYSGTGVTINGTGNVITLDFAIGATSGVLSVYGTNSCGMGAESFFDIIVEPLVISCTETTWTGLVDEDWFNAGNWNPCVPTAETDVTIPGGVPNFPTLTVAAECASMLILDGGSFIGAEYLTVAEAEVQRYFANSDFHFLSSPVTNINFGTVFPLNQDAVWAREYDEPSGDWVNLFVYDFMEVGLGYSIEMTEPQMALFPGVFNSNDVTKTLSYQNMGGDPDRAGWNLLGNPFQSAISWNAMVGIIPAAVVEAAVYVWDGAQYVSWNGFTGELTDGIIPAQNGFFVKAMVDQEIFNIPLSARVHSNIPFYKSNLANLLKLSANGNNFSDAAFIRFNEAATPLFDGQHDAYKLWGLNEAPQLYSIVPGDVLSINELPFEGNEVVNLGFRCGVGGTYSITASGMESFNASTPVMLEDLKINTIQDLRQNPVYNFTYNTSDNENRFRVHFKAATGINDPSLGGISVYSYNHTVVITNTTGLAGDVRIYDLAGRELINTSIGSQMTTRIPMQAVIGTYIVKVITEKGTVNHKVFIR